MPLSGPRCRSASRRPGIFPLWGAPTTPVSARLPGPPSRSGRWPKGSSRCFGATRERRGHGCVRCPVDSAHLHLEHETRDGRAVCARVVLRTDCRSMGIVRMSRTGNSRGCRNRVVGPLPGCRLGAGPHQQVRVRPTFGDDSSCPARRCGRTADPSGPCVWMSEQVPENRNSSCLRYRRLVGRGGFVRIPL